jgi:Tfp pilus assembly protein PilN
MINLIPPKEKEKILMERINKVVIIHWFLIFFFILCFILVLFSVKIYFKSQALAQNSMVLNAKNNQETQKIIQFKEKMQTANDEIKEQNNFQKNKIYFSNIIEKIAGILPGNIKLNNISAVLDDKKIIKVSVSGFAQSREDLVALKDKLSQESAISEIKFPTSNWVEANNINFSASFNIKP